METEFRVWCKNNKEWEKDLVVLTQEGNLFEVKCVNGKIKEFPLRKDTHIVQFYTGFKDINGQKIYEGDIVEFTLYNDSGEHKIRDVVIFSSGAFSLTKRKELLCTRCMPHLQLKVIGNIAKLKMEF